MRCGPLTDNGRVTDDQERDRESTLRPVLNGLLALVAVALAVGMVLGGAALIGTQALGLSGGDDGSSGDSLEGESLYLPPFHKTSEGGPAITLDTQGSDRAGNGGPTQPTDEPSDSKSPKSGQISLQTVETSVGNFEHIDLTGVYPGGEGAILQVQRFENGAWADFEATIPVSNETFSTYIQTGVAGLNRFRVIDNATGVSSNEVRVRVE
ncbi:hypothetical protein GCM10022242_30420 [Nocardioides panacisoli]|uniref:Discoidin domain-containing protein n=1 Tax=Nocardioides panacisoli TaxID=627624 RepID=A0ABP7IU77_9ACTN